MIDILKPILDIYDTKKEVLLFYLDASVKAQVEDFDYLDDDNDLFLNDKVYCVNRSTLELEDIGFIQAIKEKKMTLKVKGKYGVHLNKDEYHIFIKRRKNKKNDREFYKALLNAL
jgi:hypothetical protein